MPTSGARTSPLINWSDRLVHRLHRRPVDRTISRSLLLNAHFVADQLTRLFVARASSPATSVTPRRSDSSCSRTKWTDFTARTSPATPRTPRCSDIASDAGDSSVLGHRQLRRELLGARASPATPGTPRRSDIALGGRILLRLIGVLSNCSMLFGSGC